MQITFIVFMLSKIWARGCIDNFPTYMFKKFGATTTNTGR